MQVAGGSYLWNSSNISSTSANIGDSYGGGIVFYLYGKCGNTSGGLITALWINLLVPNGVVKALGQMEEEDLELVQGSKYN